MPPRPPIKISLEQLKMAAKKRRRGAPCYNEMMKVMNAAPAADFHIGPLYKYVKEYDACMEKAKAERKRGKASTLFLLSKYVDNSKNKKK